ELKKKYPKEYNSNDFKENTKKKTKWNIIDAEDESEEETSKKEPKKEKPKKKKFNRKLPKFDFNNGHAPAGHQFKFKEVPDVEYTKQMLEVSEIFAKEFKKMFPEKYEEILKEHPGKYPPYDLFTYKTSSEGKITP